MTDRNEHREQPTDDGELLSAYLLGDLDEAQASALDERLAAEPPLAARLDATREAIEALSGLDAVSPPAGYTERLRTRLAAERAAVSDSDAARAAAAAQASRPSQVAQEQTAVGDLDAARAGRARRWQPLAYAAAVVLVAVVGLAALATVLGPIRSGQQDSVATLDEAAEDSADDTAELFAEPDAGDGDQAVPAPEASPEGAESDWAGTTDRGTRPSQPAIVDAGVVLADEAAAREHFAGVGAEAFLGLEREEAEEVGRSFAVAVRRAEPFASTGVAPAVCLEQVSAEAAGPVVPAHVEAVRYAGADAVAYVLATASLEADSVDRLELWITAPSDCGIRLFADLTGD